ncbi:hypothetical protein BT69DRAFT_671648 [Atractiella rhizophila]|nr:hypothetical protein BT69DRAFT_671648 [Atractiella rhizophila]
MSFSLFFMVSCHYRTHSSTHPIHCFLPPPPQNSPISPCCLLCSCSLLHKDPVIPPADPLNGCTAPLLARQMKRWSSPRLGLDMLLSISQKKKSFITLVVTILRTIRLTSSTSTIQISTIALFLLPLPTFLPPRMQFQKEGICGPLAGPGRTVLRIDLGDTFISHLSENGFLFHGGEARREELERRQYHGTGRFMFSVDSRIIAHAAEEGQLGIRSWIFGRRELARRVALQCRGAISYCLTVHH